MYRVSIKTLYNLKDILQRQLMSYLSQISSMSSVVIRVFNNVAFVYFRHLVDERDVK